MQNNMIDHILKVTEMLEKGELTADLAKKMIVFIQEKYQNELFIE